jgi:arginine decarboxylase
VLIDRDESGHVRHWLFAEDQKEENMLKILGY